jgi:glycosyltransferase involved in cell wall biosynthesis
LTPSTQGAGISRAQRPLVSILTPSFNQAQFLGDCLATVRAQSYESLEHVVADGGSTDGSVALLEAAGASVTWSSAPDGGQGEALNRAFEVSRGEIIGWINSDDALFSTSAVSTVVDAFARDPQIDVVFGNAAHVSVDGLILREIRPHRRPSWNVLSPDASPLPQPATFVRRRAVERAGCYMTRTDLELTLDVELWVRLAASGAAFRYVDHVIAVDREYGERKTRKLAERLHEEVQLLASLYGVQVGRDPLARIRQWSRRALGIPDVILWEQRYEPAFPWHIDGLRPRLVRQIARTTQRLQVLAS